MQYRLTFVFCITEGTVFRLAPLADEYQMKSIIKICQVVFKSILTESNCSLKRRLELFWFLEKNNTFAPIIIDNANMLSICSLSSLQKTNVYCKIQRKSLIPEPMLDRLEKQSCDSVVANLRDKIHKMKKRSNDDVSHLQLATQQWNKGQHDCGCRSMYYLKDTLPSCKACLVRIETDIDVRLSKLTKDVHIRQFNAHTLPS